MKLFLTGPHGHASVHNEKELKLSTFLEARGWVLADSEDDADAICSVEVPLNSLHRPLIPKSYVNNALLVVHEPSVVRPFNIKTNVLNRFRKVVLVGRPNCENSAFWPALYLDRFSTFSAKEKLPRACMISSNRLSLVKGELYSLRRKVVDSNPVVDLYGQGWDSTLSSRLKQLLFEIYLSSASGNFPQLRALKGYFRTKRLSLGAVGDKLEKNSHYKVSVVIENSMEYMSEKLLEAIAAGSIPVYVGPKVTSFGIPGSLVVQVDPTVDSVNEGITKALEMNHHDWSKTVLEWLENIPEEEWSLDYFWSGIHKQLLEIARTSSPRKRCSNPGYLKNCLSFWPNFKTGRGQK